MEKELLALSGHQSCSSFFKVEFMLRSALFSMSCLLTIVCIFLFHWPLYQLVFFVLWLLIISLVFSSFIVSVGLLCFMLLIISLVFSSFIDHCIIWSSLFYGFWLSLWYVPLSLTIVSSGLLCFIWLLIISLVFSSFIDHRIIWSSLLDGFWLSLCYFPTRFILTSHHIDKDHFMIIINYTEVCNIINKVKR